MRNNCRNKSKLKSKYGHVIKIGEIRYSIVLMTWIIRSMYNIIIIYINGIGFTRLA